MPISGTYTISIGKRIPYLGRAIAVVASYGGPANMMFREVFVMFSRSGSVRSERYSYQQSSDPDSAFQITEADMDKIAAGALETFMAEALEEELPEQSKFCIPGLELRLRRVSNKSLEALCLNREIPDSFIKALYGSEVSEIIELADSLRTISSLQVSVEPIEY